MKTHIQIGDGRRTGRSTQQVCDAFHVVANKLFNVTYHSTIANWGLWVDEEGHVRNEVMVLSPSGFEHTKDGAFMFQGRVTMTFAQGMPRARSSQPNMIHVIDHYLMEREIEMLLQSHTMMASHRSDVQNRQIIEIPYWMG